MWNRLTPGELGLEVTTLLALAAVGGFVFVLLGAELSQRDLLAFDQASLDLADRLYSQPVEDLAGCQLLGSFAVTATLVLIIAIWAAARRLYLDAVVLVGAYLTTWLAVDVAKAAFDRPRPAGRARRDRGDVVSLRRTRPTRSPGSHARWCSCAAAAASRPASRSSPPRSCSPPSSG